MALAAKNIVVQNEDGDIQENVSIEVRREIAGSPLALIYSDRDGTTPLGNPFVSATGSARFHVAGGSYRIRAFKTGLEMIWRYVAIGTAAEFDFGTAVNFRGAWDGETDYVNGDAVSYNDGESDNYAFALTFEGDGSNAPTIDGGGVGQSDANWTVLGLAPSVGGNVSSTTIFNIEQLTQEAYDMLGEYDDATLYVITENGE